MHRRRTALIVSLTALIALGGAAFGVAQAQKSKGKIVADRGEISRTEARSLARTFVSKRVGPTAAFAARPPYGRVAGSSTKRLAGFPRSGKSFLILSTGNVLFADNRNVDGNTGQTAGGPAIRGARDVTIFRVNVQVPKNANCLAFRFRFLTEEFPEYVNDRFNDAFIAELDETTWSASTVDSPAISAPRNFAFDSKRNLISVNSVGDATVSAAQAKGTTYDGATRVLRASTPITPGKHRLYLSIFDQGDRQFDSAVFVDRLTVGRRDPSLCRSGVAVDK